MTANEPKQNGSVAAGLAGRWKSALIERGLDWDCGNGTTFW
jgi:hypothetical protein